MQKITDVAQWAAEICTYLNQEDEEGTTRIHRAFDEAMAEAIDQGVLGIEEAPDDYEPPSAEGSP